MTSKSFVVERVRRKSKLAKVLKAKAPLITITEVGFSGSLEQCVRISFSSNLSETQCIFVETQICDHECHEDIHDIRWSNQDTVVIEVRRDSLCRCSRVDVEKAVRLLAAEIPTELR